MSRVLIRLHAVLSKLSGSGSLEFQQGVFPSHTWRWQGPSVCRERAPLLSGRPKAQPLCWQSKCSDSKLLQMCHEASRNNVRLGKTGGKACAVLLVPVPASASKLHTEQVLGRVESVAQGHAVSYPPSQARPADMNQTQSKWTYCCCRGFPWDKGTDLQTAKFSHKIQQAALAPLHPGRGMSIGLGSLYNNQVWYSKIVGEVEEEILMVRLFSWNNPHEHLSKVTLWLLAIPLMQGKVIAMKEPQAAAFLGLVQPWGHPSNCHQRSGSNWSDVITSPQLQEGLSICGGSVLRCQIPRIIKSAVGPQGTSESEQRWPPVASRNCSEMQGGCARKHLCMEAHLWEASMMHFQFFQKSEVCLRGLGQALGDATRCKVNWPCWAPHPHPAGTIGTSRRNRNSIYLRSGRETLKYFW